MDAFETFYRNHLALVYAVALARVGVPDWAEDLAQDAFVRAWGQFDRLAPLPPHAQKAWLIRVVRNLVIDRWRAARHAALAETDAVAPSRPLADKVALQIDVTNALNTLDEAAREIVVLRHVMGMNSREIGELLKIPEGTVRFRLQQCRALLAERLAAWNPEKE